jgi:hypothetical protein
MASRLFGTLAVFTLLAPALPAAAAETRTGLFPAGEAYAPPAADAPHRVSRALVRTVAVAGGRVRLDVPVRGGGPLLLWTLAHGPASAPTGISLRTPGQRTLQAGQAASPDAALRRFPADTADLGLDLPGSREAILVADAEPGPHQLELDAGAGASAVTLVAAEPDSPVALVTWAGPLSRQPGQPVTLHALLRDEGQPLAGARVTARLSAPGAKAAGRAVVLHDDGRHGDGAAGDGEYAVTLAGPDPTRSGFWDVRFEAAGRDGKGLDFARTGGSGFMNEPASARLQDVRAKRTKDGRVVVEARAAVARPGRYRLDVIVAGAADGRGQRPGVAWAESSDRLPAGTSRLRVEVPLPEGQSGPCLIDVRLLGLDSPSLGGRTTVEIP